MRIRHALAIAALLLTARAGAAEPHPVTDREPAHTTHDRATAWLLTADRLEWQDREDGGATLWDVSGWYGGDVNRLWLRSEGERVDARTEHAEVQLLGGRAIAPWWTLLAGIRHDAKPGSAQTWGALGLTGTPLYGLELEATAFVGENGRTAARIEGEYDLLLTHRLVLQPRAELNLHGRTDRERGIGAGLTSVEFGLRLRYEFRREFAPYLGVAWSRSYGDTADLARARGQAVEDARLVAGVRVWF